jgi:hypothetical protein
VPTVSLSFLNRGKVKQVCRVCHEVAELKAERLCAVCVRIKAQIRSLFGCGPRDNGDSSRAVSTFWLLMRCVRRENA